MQAAGPGALSVLVDALLTVQGLLVAVSLVAMMTAMGTQLSRGDILRTTREYNLVARWVVANMLFVPLFALLFGGVFGLSTSLLVGLLLVAVAPGAPFIPTLVSMAGEDSLEAIRLTAALTVIGVLSVPLLVDVSLALVRPDLSFSPWRYLLSLFVVMVVPLAAGVAVRLQRPDLADPLGRRLVHLANVALLSALVIVVVVDLRGALQVFGVLLGTGALLVMALFVLVTVAVGWLAGGPTPESRRILALGTAGRNVNIALFIATSAFPETEADAGIVAFAVLMLVVSVGVAWYWGRHPRTDETASDRDAAAPDP